MLSRAAAAAVVATPVAVALVLAATECAVGVLVLVAVVAAAAEAATATAAAALQWQHAVGGTATYVSPQPHRRSPKPDRCVAYAQASRRPQPRRVVREAGERSCTRSGPHGGRATVFRVYYYSYT